MKLFSFLGILSAVYGGIAYTAHSGKLFFLIWFVIAGFFFLCALNAKKKLFQRLPKLLRRSIALIMVVGVGILVLCEVLILSHFHDKGAEGLDYLIVLGAQVRASGPSVVLRYRLDAAYDYLVEHPDTVCIVSGGQGANEPRPEGIVMKEYLMSRGIEEARILVEDRSVNTAANIRNSLPFITDMDAEVGIVTNNFHVFRGVSIARKQGLKAASGIASPSHLIYLPNNLFREAFGVVKDFLAGNL